MLKRFNFKSKDDLPERGHRRVRGGIKGSRGKPKRRGGKRWRRAGQRNLPKKSVKRRKGQEVDIAHVPEEPNETLSREENEKGKSTCFTFFKQCAKTEEMINSCMYMMGD